MSSNHKPTVLLADYLKLGRGSLRLQSLEDAREFYVEYHAMLAERGFFSCPGILLSAARAAIRHSATARVAAPAPVALFDDVGVNGLRTLQDLNLQPTHDIRPHNFLTHVPMRSRWRLLARMSARTATPARFFSSLFDAYGEVARHALESVGREQPVIAANERSLGCAPFLATAKFRMDREVTVVQHGNPVADYLPTLADTYRCRSDRWFSHLEKHGLVRDVRRAADFPTLEVVRFDPDCRRAALVLHNVGYLEPGIDYAAMSQRVKAACARAGWTLHVLRHPASRENYGLPEIDRGAGLPVALGIGYRSTATDQLPQGMPRVSLLDYWPDFFLRQGTEEQLADFFSRIDEALT